MELEVKKLVYDLDQAIDLIIDFTAGKRWADYQAASVFSALRRFYLFPKSEHAQVSLVY